MDLGTHTAAVLFAAFAALVSVALAVVVLRASQGGRLNRRLAALLVADPVFLVGAFVSTIVGDPDAFSPWRLAVGACVLVDALALLAFLGTLGSPAGRALGSRGGALGIAALGVVVVALCLVGLARGASVLGFGNIEGPAWILLLLASIAALALSIDAVRRTERGTVAHRRSKAAATAFIARDLITAVFVAMWAIADVRGWTAGKAIAESLGGVSILVFAALLAFGILRTQLFDVDLKVRWGIQKGTIVGIVLATSFIGEKLAENFLNKEFGWVLGSILAGLLVFAAPRLNKLGDKVAETALPKVEPTPQYVAFKKLEVYKTAVESALEDDKRIDEKERAMLDRLRVKLALSEHDARAIEAEVAGA